MYSCVFTAFLYMCACWSDVSWKHKVLLCRKEKSKNFQSTRRHKQKPRRLAATTAAKPRL